MVKQRALGCQRFARRFWAVYKGTLGDWGGMDSCSPFPRGQASQERRWNHVVPAQRNGFLLSQEWLPHDGSCPRRNHPLSRDNRGFRRGGSRTAPTSHRPDARRPATAPGMDSCSPFPRGQASQEWLLHDGSCPRRNHPLSRDNRGFRRGGSRTAPTSHRPDARRPATAPGMDSCFRRNGCHTEPRYARLAHTLYNSALYIEEGRGQDPSA